MVVRDELLLVLDLTSTILRAGVGMHDLIRGPLVELPTRLGRKTGTTGSRVEDFLVGAHLYEAEHKARSAPPGTEPEFEVVNPLRVDERTGFEVVDWVGLEAVFRFVLHTSLNLPRPPLAHPVILSVPPSLPPSTLDKLHQLLFERLLIPQLLLSSRPFFAAAAAGVLSAVILDVGYRGEGSEISVVHENAVLESAGGLRLPFVDEGVCDDWLALQLLEADPAIPAQFAGARGLSGPEQLAPGEVAYGLRAMVGELKVRDLIKFESPLMGAVAGAAAAAGAGAAAGAAGAGDEEGSFDVAKAIADGKVGDLVNKKKGGSSGKDADGDGDSSAAAAVEVKNPFAPPLPPVDLSLGPNDQPPPPPFQSITLTGPTRHRYLEPLFLPALISHLAPSASPTAALLGLGEYERFASGEGRRQADTAGVHEAVGVVLGRVEDEEVRSAVSEAVVVVSSGRVGSIKALGATLAPLLSPFRPSPDSSTLAAIAAEGGAPPQRGVRYAPTPEYFANFKERGGEWGCYLGAGIMGKLLIGDAQSKLFMTKQEYAQHGPAYYRLLDAL
ncbi:hypothetical protein JCM6882_007603 [Rhodosporidiobolus microsporus]